VPDVCERAVPVIVNRSGPLGSGVSGAPGTAGVDLGGLTDPADGLDPGLFAGAFPPAGVPLEPTLGVAVALPVALVDGEVALVTCEAPAKGDPPFAVEPGVGRTPTLGGTTMPATIKAVAMTAAMLTPTRVSWENFFWSHISHRPTGQKTTSAAITKPGRSYQTQRSLVSDMEDGLLRVRDRLRLRLAELREAQPGPWR
jgi:hypothetical protein